MANKNKDNSFLNKKLFNAANIGDDQAIRNLLLEGADINSLHVLGATPFLVAVANNYTSSVKLLAEMGADINIPTNEGTTPLSKAAYKCYSDITKFLIDSGADQEVSGSGYTPFWLSIYSGCVENVRYFLEDSASILSDNLRSPLYLSAKLQDKNDAHKEVHKIIMDDYWKLLGDYPSVESMDTFEVVVVRYKEDLSWIAKEFKNERVIVYNKGEDDLDYLAANCKVIKTANVGWFGGTILLHIVNNYGSLADTTLFLQADPYNAEAFLPMARYKASLNSTCDNIVAKCETSSLLYHSNYFSNLSEKDWIGSRYKCFDEPLNFSLIEFVHQYIDKSYSPEGELHVDLGAQFSVRSPQVHLQPKSFYEKILTLFDKKCPRADFYLEKVWDIIFKPKDISELNSKLLEAVALEDMQAIEDLLLEGADINSLHVIGATPIFAAAALNKTKSVKLLSNEGANLEISTEQMETPLFKAAHRCHSEITRTLLQAGANIEKSVNGYTPLYAAISSGCVEDVKILLEAGALTHSDNEIDSPILIAIQVRDRGDKNREIYNITKEKYDQELDKFHVNRGGVEGEKSFRVVVARYDEDLLWLNKEFKDEKIVIYNKGKNNLNLETLPAHTVVINIPNFGWFGGTILYHLANYYDHLDDRTLFLQGEPYDQHLFLPLIRYKDGFLSKCTNILARCVEKTLLEQSNQLAGITEEVWATTKYGGKFKLFHNYTMVDFAHQYIDRDIIPEDPLFMVWGAQFAVDKEKVYLHSEGFYKKLLKLFNKKYPMEDFFLEKLWNEVFQEKNISELNKELYNSALAGDNQGIIEALVKGAEINSLHYRDSTPLFAAGAVNKLSSVKLLILLGADVNLSMDNGESALYRAASFCREDMVRLLLEYGANKEDVHFGMQTALYGAVGSNCIDSAKVLLDVGANTYRDDTSQTVLRISNYKVSESEEYKEIRDLVMNYYWNGIDKASLSIGSFRVVVVRYNEDLLWLNKEFSDEEIIIYNKGADDLNLADLPINSEVINILNVGWFGGTILYHLANFYDDLADRTLFLQGYPYEDPLINPLVKYKGEYNSSCISIIGKCETYSLLTESEQFSEHRTNETWAKTKYGGKFKLFNNYTMIDFAHQYIDKNMPPEEPLTIVLGAQFAVDKENVYYHKKEFYQNMLPIFNETYPMADFYIEKLWPKIFSPISLEMASENLVYSLE